MTGHMSQEDKDRVAQQHFGKPFEQLDTAEKRAVGGFFRADALGHEGYSEMGKHGHGGQGGKHTTTNAPDAPEVMHNTRSHDTPAGHSGGGGGEGGHHMTAEEKDRVAKEHFGRSFEELDTSEKRAVGGYYRGEHTAHGSN